MSQVFDSSKPESGVTTIGELYAILRNHQEAIRSCFSGTSSPSSPATGQLWFDTANEILKAYNGSAWVDFSTLTAGYLNRAWAARSFSGTDQSIDVDGVNLVELTATAASATIADFTNSRGGQRLILLNVGANSFDVKNNSNIILAGGSDITLATNDTMHLVDGSDGNWYMMANSDNS